jgi:hypothetical protein
MPQVIRLELRRWDRKRWDGEPRCGVDQHGRASDGLDNAVAAALHKRKLTLPDGDS